MTRTTLLFIGDIVGDAGLSCLEACLPELIARHSPDFVVANAENLVISSPRGGCGMSVDIVRRLFRLPIDLVTGGNHSWDHPESIQVFEDGRLLRPLNYGRSLPGRGAHVVCKRDQRLGVINVVSKTALPLADEPLDVLQAELDAWYDPLDCVLIDFHGESAEEKLTIAFALDGQVSAVLGTHTHVPTDDAQILPGGTAYITDVGMTGPQGGILGYDPALFVNSMRLRKRSDDEFRFAPGEARLGAVLIRCEDGRAVAIERLREPKTASTPYAEIPVFDGDTNSLSTSGNI